MDRGNLLKVDGHKYVKIAFHGKKRLPKDLRHKLYNSESFKAAHLLSVDTFFALSEVQLFTEIVDYMDRHPAKIKKTYREVYQDLRRFIDLSHADGSIKNVVLADPGRFIRKDKHLAATLAQYIEAGKALFLLTNSSWDYTNAMMSFVLDEPTEDFPDWRHYFEHVLVGAGKPGFFVGSQPFYEVMTDTGLLKLASGPLKPNGVYHGGNANLFQKLTGVVGDQILFVGDHIYGDIIRSKHHVNWRTMLIVEELDVELPKLEKLKERFGPDSANGSKAARPSTRSCRSSARASPCTSSRPTRRGCAARTRKPTIFSRKTRSWRRKPKRRRTSSQLSTRRSRT